MNALSNSLLFAQDFAQDQFAQDMAQAEAQMAGAAGAGAACMGVMMLIYLVAIVVIVVGLWKVFEKAGKPGWAAIIPIYNFIVLLEIAGRPIWWILLLFIPVVNLVVSILIYIDVAQNFGKDALYGLGLFFLPFIFFPILGFSDAKYQPKAS